MMLESVRRRCPWLPAALLLAAALAVVPAAFGASLAYPAKARVGGVKSVDWVGHWNQWFYSAPVVSSLPAGYHPVDDVTGDYAGIGQRGPVWFLTPGDAPDQITRDIRIPAGVALFFPIKYSQYDNAGQIPSDWLTRDELYAIVKADIDSVDISEYFCTLESVRLTDLAKRRLKSSVFSYGVAPDTLPTFFPPPTPVAGEMINPAVADGYWVMLRPLTVGNHVVTYGRDVGTAGELWTLTYNITVVAPQE